MFLALAAGATFFTPAITQDDPLQKRDQAIRDAVRKATEAFVFIAGGSGVLISPDGYFLTNHHVAGPFRSTTIQRPSGQQFVAERIATDEVGDLSVFKMKEAKDLPYLELADSDKLEVGQLVLALGNPFGTSSPTSAGEERIPTVSLGVISTLHRFQGTYFNCIQTDAAVNPGNSGGPLVTLRGTLAGITGRIATRFGNRVNSGVGYAIPANQIRNFLPEMMHGGEVTHGCIGGLNLSREHTNGLGVRVRSVKPKSTAAKAGLLADDLITKVDQYPIPSFERYFSVTGTYPRGTSIHVTFKRRSEEHTVVATLDKRLEPSFLDGETLQVRPKGSGWMGFNTRDTEEGVLIEDVVPDGPAALAGLEVGDLIVKFNRRRVDNVTHLRQLIWFQKPKQKVPVFLRQGDTEIERLVTLGKHPDD